MRRLGRAGVAAGAVLALLAVGGTAMALSAGSAGPGEDPAPLGTVPARCAAAFEALPPDAGDAELGAAGAEERACLEDAVRDGDLDPAVLESFRRQDRRDTCAALASLEDEAACRARHVAAGELEPFVLGDLAYERCSRLLGDAVTDCVEAEVTAGRIAPGELAGLRCDDVYASLPPDATEEQWAALAPAHAACVDAAAG